MKTKFLFRLLHLCKPLPDHELNKKTLKKRLSQKRISKGGIFAMNPNIGEGAANALKNKFDFTVQSGKKETVFMRWFPDLFNFAPCKNLN